MIVVNINFDLDAILPQKVTKELAEMLVKNDLNGVCISTESEELGIYKSFNYEIFERRPSVVLAFDGNSPVSNLVQEAKNGKGKARIYINDSVDALKEKAKSLDGYVTKFSEKNEEIINGGIGTIYGSRFVLCSECFGGINRKGNYAF